MQVDAATPTRGLGKVILASSIGTLIEWYDFFVFGSLATILAGQFFPKGNPTAALLSTLATFATGFVVRPFGALVFGRMGDLVGRKHTFMLTLGTMGLATFCMGLVPTYESIGVFAPLLVLLLRLIQGLALGGEYGGATTYVAENSPSHRQGYFTSFIQATATLGLLLSLIVILFTRTYLGETVFSAWGWRVPFLLSALLIIVAFVIRMRMAESPLFAKLKQDGTVSKNPLAESFLQPANRKLVLIALFGATMGQGVVWYTSQFYALYFLQTVLKFNGAAANKIIAWALVLGTPFFIVFGALSDRIGRKKLIMLGLILAVLCYVPIYSKMEQVGTFDTENMTTLTRTTESIDQPSGGSKIYAVKTFTDPAGMMQIVKNDTTPGAKKGEPKVEFMPGTSAFWTLVFLIWLQVLFATLAYGPIAAFLVELFPTRIRYTSLSVPYHIGNGIFGGLVPLVGTWLVTSTGNNLSGLLYPIGAALITFIVGMIFIKERSTDAGFEEGPG